MAKKNRKNDEGTVETITAADVVTLNAEEIIGEALPPVQNDTPVQPSAQVATEPLTLSRKNTHRNGYHVYGVDGVRGSVFLSKSLIVGIPPETITLGATATGEGNAQSGLVYIDPTVAAQKREQREKREARKANLAQRREERKTKTEARLAKLQAQLDKMKAKEAALAAKTAPKPGDVPTGGDVTEGQPATEGVEQPFTEPLATV